MRPVFLSCMGGIYFMAFSSYWVQYEGLLGLDGLLPAANYWDAARRSPPGTEEPERGTQRQPAGGT